METKYFKKGDTIRYFQCDNGIAIVTIEINNVWVSNPTIQMLKDDGWEEYTPPTPPPYVPTREEKIHEEIRMKYTENDEFMILRQYNSNPTNPAYKAAFDEYNAYVEEVLAKYPEENE